MEKENYDNKSKKERRKEQKEFYDKNLAPVLEKYEKIKHKHYIAFLCIIITPIIITAIAAFVEKDPSLFGIYVICLCPFLLFSIICYSLFTKRIKKETLPIIFEYFKDINWVENHFISKSIIKRSGIINSKGYPFYEGYGCFYGKHKDINFEVSLVNFHIPHGRPHIFIGMVIAVDTKKKFIGQTVILLKYRKASYLKDLSKVNIDNPEFNKYYAAYTDNDNEAKNLISPSFVKALTTIFSCIGFMAESYAFYKDKFYITINTSELYAFLYMGSYFDKINTPKNFYRICDTIEAIQKLLERFELDEKANS